MQTWVETRKINKDLKEEELDPAWAKIKKEGFEHAFEQVKSWIATSKALGNKADAENAEEIEKKFQQVFDNPTEKLNLY